MLLAGVGWLVFTLPQKLDVQDKHIQQVLTNQQELKYKIAQHEYLLRQHDVRLTREELEK